MYRYKSKLEQDRNRRRKALDTVLDSPDSTAQQRLDAVQELNRMDAADDRRKRWAAKKKAGQPDQPRPAATEAAAAKLMAELNEEFPKKPAEQPAIPTASCTAQNVLPAEISNTVQPPPAEPAPIPEACKVVICLRPATHELGQHGKFCEFHYKEGVAKGMHIIVPNPAATAADFSDIHRQGNDYFDPDGWERSKEVWREQVAEENEERARLIRIIEDQRRKEHF